MKSERLIKLLRLSFGYFLILAGLVLASFNTGFGGAYFLLDLLFAVVVPASMILPGLYMVLYKKKWIIVPAKIIFSIHSLLFFLTFDFYYLLSFITLLASVIPLVHLYWSDIKRWLSSLKNKPRYLFKKKTAISRLDIIFIALAIMLAITQNNYFFIYGAMWLLILLTTFTIAYLLSKISPLKSILKVAIFSLIIVFIKIVFDDYFGLEYGILIYVSPLLLPALSAVIIFCRRD